MMWSFKHKNHLFIVHNGQIVYKRWYMPNSTAKAQNSVLFNKGAWPTVWIE